jgi:large subunit ribosomal protein L15
MKLENLKPIKGSINRKKRIGRGQGTCMGGTSTRGNKGAKSRSGNYRKIGFEGGQMPLYRRIPKFGFNHLNKKFSYMNLYTIQSLVEKNKIYCKINPNVLKKIGRYNKYNLLKILGKGSLHYKLKILAHKFSKSAIKAIQKLDGEAIIL